VFPCWLSGAGQVTNLIDMAWCSNNGDRRLTDDVSNSKAKGADATLKDEAGKFTQWANTAFNEKKEVRLRSTPHPSSQFLETLLGVRRRRELLPASLACSVCSAGVGAAA
jgi:hypothetical protein